MPFCRGSPLCVSLLSPCSAALGSSRAHGSLLDRCETGVWVLRFGKTRQDLEAIKAEIVFVMHAEVQDLAASLEFRTSYLPQEIFFNHRSGSSLGRCTLIRSLRSALPLPFALFPAVCIVFLLSLRTDVFSQGCVCGGGGGMAVLAGSTLQSYWH